MIRKSEWCENKGSYFSRLLERIDIRRSIPWAFMRLVENFVRLYFSAGLKDKMFLIFWPISIRNL